MEFKRRNKNKGILELDGSYTVAVKPRFDHPKPVDTMRRALDRERRSLAEWLDVDNFNSIWRI